MRGAPRHRSRRLDASGRDRAAYWLGARDRQNPRPGRDTTGSAARKRDPGGNLFEGLTAPNGPRQLGRPPAATEADADTRYTVHTTAPNNNLS